MLLSVFADEQTENQNGIQPFAQSDIDNKWYSWEYKAKYIL